MCFNRAHAWALRDGFSDVLMGIGIVEEVRDFEVEERRNRVTDTSDLEALPSPAEPKAKLSDQEAAAIAG